MKLSKKNTRQRMESKGDEKRGNDGDPESYENIYILAIIGNQYAGSLEHACAIQVC